MLLNVPARQQNCHQRLFVHIVHIIDAYQGNVKAAKSCTVGFKMLFDRILSIVRRARSVTVFSIAGYPQDKLFTLQSTQCTKVQIDFTKDVMSHQCDTQQGMSGRLQEYAWWAVGNSFYYA
jgi:hypothetical protein